MHRALSVFRYFLGVALLVAATPVFAQDLTVNVTNAPPDREVEVVVSGTGVSASDTATSDAGGSLSMLLNVGSLGKAQRVEVEVYIEDCADGAKVHLVAPGGTPPADCDEETQGDQCNCRRAGAFWLGRDTVSVTVDFSSGAISTGSSTTGFVAGFGADFVFFGGEDPGLRSDVTRVLETDDRGIDFAISLEYGFLPWLGVGFAYENLSEIGLEGTLTFIEDPRFTIDSSGTIDPWVMELYARPSYALARNVVVHGVLGVAYWRADTNSTEIVFFDDTALESFASSAENNGLSPVIGAGIDFWFLDWMGLRGAFKWVKLEDTGNSDGADLDRSATAARVLVVFNLSNLAR